jgi:hypothetical protein
MVDFDSDQNRNIFVIATISASRSKITKMRDSRDRVIDAILGWTLFSAS